MKPSETPRTSTLTSLSSSDPGKLGTLQKPFELGYSQQRAFGKFLQIPFHNHQEEDQWANPQHMLREEKDSERKRS